jgi:hypothetical protein
MIPAVASLVALVCFWSLSVSSLFLTSGSSMSIISISSSLGFACLFAFACILISSGSRKTSIDKDDAYNDSRKNTSKGDSKSITYVKGFVAPRNKKEEEYLSKARSLAKQLLSLLKKQRDPTARKILNSSYSISHDDIHLFDDPSSNSYALTAYNDNSMRASIFISVDKIKNPNENKGRLQSTLCHEIAHVLPGGHTMGWREAYLYLMNMTSNDLGWRNELTCDICDWYDICKKVQCPKCTWREGDHDKKCAPDKKNRGDLLI